MISIDNIPQSLRYPGAYINIDASKANLGTTLPAVLLVGQKLPSGTAPAGEYVLISDATDAANKAGAGSMLADMAAAYLGIDSVFDVYLLPYADNPAGVAASAPLVVTSQATANGTLPLYIAGKLASIGISVGDTTDAIAANIANAISPPNTSSCTFSGYFVGNILTVTAITAGAMGVGQALTASMTPSGELFPDNVTIESQISGLPGGLGAYAVSVGVNQGAVFNGHIAGNQLISDGGFAGDANLIGLTVLGSGVAAGTVVIDGAGNPYTINTAQTVASGPLTFNLQLSATLSADQVAPLYAVSATVSGSTVTLTANHKGSCGNNIDIRLALMGEPVPAGLGISLTALTGGTGDPAAGDLPTLMGSNIWFRYVALGMNDPATLAAWHAESQRRYKPPVQAGFRAFTAFRGDFEQAAAFGVTCNYEHIANLSLEINPTTTWESAAMLAAACGPALFNNPVQSLEGIQLTGMVAQSYHIWGNANSLLFKGMSVMQIERDGSCSIKRIVTMFQFTPSGGADDAYLDINTPEVMERIRYEQITGANTRFVGTAAAKDDEGYRPGLRITTIDSVQAFLLSLYKNTLMQQYGWVQNYDYYKSTLVVEQDPNNPSRFNYVDQPVILSPYYILAGDSQFLKVVK